MLLLLFAGVNYQTSSREASQPERTVITVEDNKGLIAKIFGREKTGMGPDVVKLPHPPRTSSDTQPPKSAKPQPGTGTTVSKP